MRLAVHRDDDDDGVGAGALPCKFECVVAAGDLKDAVRAAAFERFASRFKFPGREHACVRVVCAYKFAPRRVFFADENLGRRAQLCALQRAYPRRTRAYYRYGRAALDLGDLCRPISGREDVADKQRVQVVHSVRDERQPIVRHRNARISRLNAVYTAAERPSSVGKSAVVDPAVAAEKAIAAKGLDVDRDAVAGTDFAHRAPDLADNADRFVPDRYAGDGARHLAVFDVKVARAYRRERDFDDRVRRRFDGWKRLFDKAKITV